MDGFAVRVEHCDDEFADGELAPVPELLPYGGLDPLSVQVVVPVDVERGRRGSGFVFCCCGSSVGFEDERFD
jgi:hypothetical protein